MAYNGWAQTSQRLAVAAVGDATPLPSRRAEAGVRRNGQPRAARGPAGGRTPRASACGCIGRSAARRPQGAALNKYGNSNHLLCH